MANVNKVINIKVGGTTQANRKAYMQFEKDILKMGLNFKREQRFLRLRIANEILKHVKNLTPTGISGNLKNNWFVEDHDDMSEVYNNEKYVAPIELGKQQKRRWVPGYWKGDRFVYQKGSKEGMMLKKKKIKGHFMLRDAVREAKQAIPIIIKDALDDAARRAFRK